MIARNFRDKLLAKMIGRNLYRTLSCRNVGHSSDVKRLAHVSYSAAWFATTRKSKRHVPSSVSTEKANPSKFVEDEDREFQDMTAIPAGIDLYATFIAPNRPASLNFRVDCKSTLLHNIESWYLFAANVPHGATEEDIRRAIAYKANPDEVFLLVNNAMKSVRPRFIKVASRRSAILHFKTREERDKLVTPETKLFGVLCKSSGEPKDTERLMFLEPADHKRSLIITDIPEGTKVSDFKRSLPEHLAGSGLELSNISTDISDDARIGNHYLVLTFPSVCESFAAVWHLQKTKSLNAAYSNFRSVWKPPTEGREGYYDEMPCLTSYDP